MANFYFKQFTVRQTGAAMKVNTDGVLLPAWVAPHFVQGHETTMEIFPYILDAGSGTGVISLIMAQRCQALYKNFRIEAIDVDKESYMESSYNFSVSKWSGNLIARHISLQQMALERESLGLFDMVLSNPPYFTNSLKAPCERRTIARHNTTLPLAELLESSFLLLKNGGVLAVILPSQEGEELISLVNDNNMFSVQRICKVRTVVGKDPKRYMMELRKVGAGSIPKEPPPAVCHQLVMQQSGGIKYTGEYVNLVKDYYLKEFEVASD